MGGRRTDSNAAGELGCDTDLFVRAMHGYGTWHVL